MRNSPLVAFIKTGCVIDTKDGVFKDYRIVFVVEGATNGAIRDPGDLFAYNHVKQ